jgi:glutathione S-transferase
MITLYTFGPAFGLPDPSPFVTKAELLIKLSGQPYETKFGDVRRAPKGKLPYINDEGERIADSTFIRFHLERKYNVDLDRGLSAEERATAWAFEKMLEDHLYWIALDARWMDEANFNKGPRHFFNVVPAAVRPFVVAMVKRSVRKALHAQGTGRHSAEEILTLGKKALDAVANYLDEKPFFMGAEPKAIDATVFPFIAGILCPFFEAPLRTAAEQHANLQRYVGRMAARYYPETK